MKTRNMAMCALFSALLCICAWIAVPVGQISVTLQTFGVFLCLYLLGGKQGSGAVFVYLFLGAVGLPVFTGFRGGIGVLLGATGGYIWGLGACALLYWFMTAWLGYKSWVKTLSTISGLLLCYLLGSLWYGRMYLQGQGIAAILLQCVVPYILPDLIKILLAVSVSKRLKKYI